MAIDDHKFLGLPTIGIIMLDTQFPRILGDAGRAETWNFPVIFKVVEGVTPQYMRAPLTPTLLGRFQEAAQELEKQGVVGITSTCGLLSPYQREISEVVKVPVFISSLLQVPLAYQILKKDQKVGIITIDSRALNQAHLAVVAGDSIPIAVSGVESGSELSCTVLENKRELNFAAAEQDMVQGAKNLLRDHPTVGAIVLECANMAPYAKAVQDAVKLPVFDITTLTYYIYHSLVRKKFL